MVNLEVENVLKYVFWKVNVKLLFTNANRANETSMYEFDTDIQSSVKTDHRLTFLFIRSTSVWIDLFMGLVRECRGTKGDAVKKIDMAC